MDIMNAVKDNVELSWEKTLLNYLKPKCEKPIIWK